ncbi:MAG: hypothetical protein QOG94_2100 [Solirubrobacteraceae bacterium]|nr:hypothetical protein [Solirubrobacteraceae bacterium]
MRSRISRHLGLVLGSAPQDDAALDESLTITAPGEAPLLPSELSGRDYAIFLLRLAAEVEHALMVQYLFTAYSLGAPGLAAGQQAEVRAWQETILGIAKEEMAHLITVENLLTLLSAPLNFNREEFPHDTVLYPFEFKLERASLRALAAFVCAESPARWPNVPEEQEIKELARQDAGAPVNRVGRLYAELARVVGDRTLLADGDFDADTVAFQATWDEWGRGYREGERGAEPMSGFPELLAPELLILHARSRAEALAAITEVGEQGEGADLPADGDQSHFLRFLAIYRGMKRLGDGVGVRPLAPNPTTDLDGPDVPRPQGPAPEFPATAITHGEARLWAHLFNVRYRKLLVNLSHAFELADDPGEAGRLTPRGALIHRTFSEMYNLRAIAGRLVALPVDAADPGGPRAGPPFQIPHTLMLPPDEVGRWRLHRDVLDAAAAIVLQLRATGSPDGADYLAALAQMDAIERGQLELLIAGRVAARRGAPTP